MSGPLILIVDDDDSIRLLLAALCRRCDFECEMAADGLQALARLQSRQFDVVLLDLMMPRMNGYEVIEEVSKTPGWRPAIIVLTAQGARQTTSLDGTIVHTMIQKPFDLNTLMTILTDVAGAMYGKRLEQ